ncbi:hypothetical protein VFPFJ_04056 [Purpureocillium lilacinum]|uniref:Uncharacterized protein n=1 Tax=Purpureocillium lilacinum TaxID=33203 RepID=A0A179HPE9_PURLI|nr:hypothetical protein VFPFJ_04056 [Purpureocillium lilacinum]OAQ92316.1 hypothetical protein VFPFJ_04056 [Purpureocillium lilacinum]
MRYSINWATLTGACAVNSRQIAERAPFSLILRCGLRKQIGALRDRGAPFSIPLAAAEVAQLPISRPHLVLGPKAVRVRVARTSECRAVEDDGRAVDYISRPGKDIGFRSRSPCRGGHHDRVAPEEGGNEGVEQSGPHG